MQIDPKTSAAWMSEFAQQHRRGKHVLLYGDITDQFLFNAEYMSLLDFLGRYLKSEGYELIGRYDFVDGLQLADPAKMETQVEQIVRLSLGGEPIPTSATASNVAGTEIAPTAVRGVPRASRRTFTGSVRAPEQAFAAIRAVLAQSNIASAMIVNFCDQLTGQPDHLSEGERGLMVQLKKTFHNAGYLRSGRLAGLPNRLVLVAGQLGKVPPWLFQENPLVALVQVTRPGLLERESFLRSFVANFHQGDGQTPAQVENLAREFADLTDGLTSWDLEAIRRTSRAEHLPVTQPKSLVDYYKYGRRDDPWEQLDSGRVRAAKSQLEGRVIGQNAAVDAVVRVLVSARVGISMSEVTAKSGKPKGTLFFVGPTGVGKTELAKALAGLVFGDDTAFTRFDMSEYAEAHAAEKLAGSPPGYVGYEEGGHLTNRIREKPFGIILFDEIEKAHGRVMDKFLQVLEDGRLTDGKGQTAYFSQSLIIFTSNIGSDTLSARSADEGELPSYEEVRTHYLAAVRSHFTRPVSSGGLGRPELLNRLGDNIIVFDLLRPEHIAAICRKFLCGLASSARAKRGIELTFGEELLALVQRQMRVGDNILFGGRRIKSLLETIIERPLNERIFFNNPKPGSKVAVKVAPDNLAILINGAEAETIA
jgi:hypothetical protein